MKKSNYKKKYKTEQIKGFLCPCCKEYIEVLVWFDYKHKTIRLIDFEHECKTNEVNKNGK